MDKENNNTSGEAESIYKENTDGISSNNSTISDHIDTSSSDGNMEKIDAPYFGNNTISDVSNISSFSSNVEKNDTNLLIVTYSIILAILSLFLVCAFFYVSKKKLYEKEKDRYIKEKSKGSSINSRWSLIRSEYYDSLSRSYSNTQLYSSRSNSNRPSTTNLSSLSRESINSYSQLNKYSSNIEKINNETLTSHSLSRYPNSLNYYKMNHNQYPRSNQIKNESYSNTYKPNEADKSIQIPKAVITTNGKSLFSNKEDYCTI